MNIFIILLLSLDLRARCLHQPDSSIMEHSQDFEMVVLSSSESDKCPKAIEPLCATNGKEYLYFQNRCVMEVKNFEFLTQGLLEYSECPSIFCKTVCPNCAFINDPVCATELITGNKEIFQNACEVERKMCTTKRAWTLVNMNECIRDVLNRVLKPLNNLLQKAVCPTFCPPEYRPICARFMHLEQEFANECELNMMICRYQQDWHITRQGPCQQPNIKAGNQFSTIDSKCLEICPTEYKPICAKFHNEMRVFDNICELDKIICIFGENWQIVKEGPCLDDGESLQHLNCPDVCPNDHKPVCARFGNEYKEFSNFCELLKENCATGKNWEIVNWEPCTIDFKQPLLSTPKCPQSCSESLYTPMCAENGSIVKQFRNLCELQKAICETGTDWKLLKDGHCPLGADLEDTCRIACTEEIDPVCASHDDQFREFLNSCELEKHSRMTNTVWKFVKWGSCPQYSHNTSPNSSACPKLCSGKFKPMCAKFHYMLREFINECEMQKAICETNIHWQLLKRGRCPLLPNTRDPCYRPCAQEFSPVCARFDGKLREFFNSCELEKMICETNIKWEILHRGPCFANQFKMLVKNSCENDLNDPVCAINGYRTSTFYSICEMAKEIERSGKLWSILHRGTCEDTTNNLDMSKRATSSNETHIGPTEGKEGESLKEKRTINMDDDVNYNKKDNTDFDKSQEFKTEDDNESYQDWVAAQTHTADSSEEHDSESPQISDTPKKKKNLNIHTVTENATNVYENLPKEHEGSQRNPKEVTSTNAMENLQPAKDLEDNVKTVKSQANVGPLKKNSKQNYDDSGILVNQADSFKEITSHGKINLINNTATNEDLKLNVNETRFRKGEIYNGAVYKAPVYDAPTYNFIYTGPISYPGFELHHPHMNNSTLAQNLMTRETAEVPFHPFHLFTSLAAMSGTNLTKSNLMPLPPAGNGEPTKLALSLPTLSPSLAAKLQSFLPPGKLPLNSPLSSKPYQSPSSEQKCATPLNSTQNSTLLNEIKKTLKALTS